MTKDKREKAGAVIVAAGMSRRMGGLDKVFSPLGDKPVLARVIDTFQACDAIDQIVIVLTEQKLKTGEQMVTEYGWTRVTDICPGGPRRQDSVMAGLDRLVDCHWALIHDGARPLVTVELIEQGLAAARDTGAAIAAVPVTDTIKVAAKDLIVQGTPPRDTLWAVQTPQVFRYNIVTGAYRRLEDEVTDDSRPVEHLGYSVRLYMGSYDNIKITTPEDLALAEILWQKKDGK